jgi:hypothetical protein
MENYLPQTLKLTVLVALMLVVIAFFSRNERDFGAFSIKKMDILADIRSDSMNLAAPILVNKTVQKDSVSQKNQPKNCPDSLVCLEDYTTDGVGLRTFFQKIDSLKSKKNQVRVAFFGDSFVEGDILLADLRDTLQKIWGGRGPGWLPMSSPAGGIMRSINFSAGNSWEIRDIVHDEKDPRYGISGHFYTPKSASSWTNFEAARFFPTTGKWSQARVFYQKKDSVAVAYKINDAEKTVKTMPFGAEINQFLIKSTEMNRLALSFGPTDGLTIFGTSLEDADGFYIDNFSVRGNAGGRLKKVETATYQRFDALLKYDLIIMQYGMNAVTTKTNNIPWYEKELDDAIIYLKNAFPGRPILLIGCPDRGGKVGGELHTMPAVPLIVDMERRLAQKNGLLFFDLFHAMGGPDATIRLSEMHPIFAYKDYTHLTHEGGRMVALRMARAFFEAKKLSQNVK